MSKIISIHSFRGGTGKSNTTANLAVLFAQAGKKVGVVDTDIQSPGIHVLFRMEEQDMKTSLNDYLWGKAEIHQAAYNVTKNLEGNIEGEIYLIPSSMKAGEIARILREGYDINLLNEGFRNVIDELKLDILLIDTHPGLNEETLLSIAISDAMLIVMRPDQQDYQGTRVTVEVARKLDVPRMSIIVNKVPTAFIFEDVRMRVQQVYRCDVAAILPHSDEMMMLASEGVFVHKFPDHAITKSLKNVVNDLL